MWVGQQLEVAISVHERYHARQEGSHSTLDPLPDGLPMFGREAGLLRFEGPQITLGCLHPFHILCLLGSNKTSALLLLHCSCVFHVFLHHF